MVKVYYVGKCFEQLTDRDLHRAAAASIDTCVTDLVTKKMKWPGRSFGLLCSGRAYVCIERPRLRMDSATPSECGRFFNQFGLDSGISHNDEHAGNFGVLTTTGQTDVTIAFDFERSTVIHDEHPRASEQELTAYADAVQNRDQRRAAEFDERSAENVWTICVGAPFPAAVA